LFLIDDTKDSDTTNEHDKKEIPKVNKIFASDFVQKIRSCETIQDLLLVWKEVNTHKWSDIDMKYLTQEKDIMKNKIDAPVIENPPY